jgi:hypothetical protein
MVRRVRQYVTPLKQVAEDTATGCETQLIDTDLILYCASRGMFCVRAVHMSGSRSVTGRILDYLETLLKLHRSYEGVSKSFRTESITK